MQKDYDIEVGTMNIVTRRLNRAITTQDLTILKYSRTMDKANGLL